MKILFTKMHGLGNDFVVIDGRKTKIPSLNKAAKFLCDRRFGVGADQLLLLGSSKKADFRMDIFNADGSTVEMCGNGLRCIAKYVFDAKLMKKKEVVIETLSGLQTVKVLPKDQFQVNMGEPILRGRQIPVNLSGRVINRPLRTEGQEFRVTCVSMGNPHCVIFVEDLIRLPVAKYGPLVETHRLFPKKTNVEFVQVNSRTEIEMRVWERGAGETLACGSGACGAVVASVLNGMTDRKVRVNLPGGVLNIEWNRETNHVFMTGPATEVFKGTINV